MHRSDSLLRTVAGKLMERSDELVERQLTALRAFSSYERVPEDDLRRSCLRNIARVVATLEQQKQLPSAIEEDERASGRRRALQGVPSDDVQQAYRVVLSVLRDAFIEEAHASNADPRDVLAGTRRLWDLTDRYSSVLVAARQQVEIEAARRDERHRVAFLQRLLVGLEPEELAEGGAVHGVLPDHEYWVSRGRAPKDRAQQLSRHLEASVATGFRPLVAPFDEDVVSVSTRRPTALDDAVVAVAGPVRLLRVSNAFDEATRVLDVAVRYGRTGIVDRSSLSIRLAVERHGELGEELYQRYLILPVQPGLPAADLVDTVRTYLRARRSVAATARALSVHENTVRYRLDRYQCLVAADLSDTDRLVEVWWALEYATIRRS